MNYHNDSLVAPDGARIAGNFANSANLLTTDDTEKIRIFIREICGKK